MSYKELKFPENSVFLVTGGAGFIGSNLCEAILDMGYKVKCLDNLSTGFRKNVDLFINHPNYTFIEGDIRDFNTCMMACNGVDFVLHQAAWGSVPRSIEMPLLYEEINIKGTLNMLEAAKKNDVKKFVYASSSSVYGEEPNLPKVEGREGNLLSPYAITKRVNEEYGKIYKKLYGLDTYGLRYFNVFGRRQNPNGFYAAVIPKWIKQILVEESPIVNGDGTQSRDFTYIDNVIQANLKCCLSDRDKSGDIYNIANGERTSLLELLSLINSLLSKKVRPTFGKIRQGDIMHSNANIDKAKSKLGYMVDVQFKEGLKETIGWFINEEK